MATAMLASIFVFVCGVLAGDEAAPQRFLAREGRRLRCGQ
jgi:hypothetical protein